MKKEDVLREIERCENGIKTAYERLDALEKENAALRELVHHLASRPPPVQYIPPSI
jgi:predicted nuclease with TOPRIM domain